VTESEHTPSDPNAMFEDLIANTLLGRRKL